MMIFVTGRNTQVARDTLLFLNVTLQQIFAYSQSEYVSKYVNVLTFKYVYYPTNSEINEVVNPTWRFKSR